MFNQESFPLLLSLSIFRLLLDPVGLAAAAAAVGWFVSTSVKLGWSEEMCVLFFPFFSSLGFKKEDENTIVAAAAQFSV